MTTTLDGLPLGEQLLHIAAAEGGPMFMDKPERWWDRPTWRCLNEHVSARYLRTERGERCLGCSLPEFSERSRVWLTFPEDIDGPLRVPS